MLRNEKGLTLIELLAVVVILGIIAAIAIPSIGGLIDNSKKDAHVANAKQMVNAARLATTSDTQYQQNTWYMNLKYLEDKKYLEPVSDPDKTANGYTKGSNALIQNAEITSESYVKVTEGKIVKVYLTNGTRTLTNTVESTEEVNKLTRNNIQ